MAGESEYINPIIESMFRTAQLHQQVAQRKQQNEQFQQEQKLREQQETAHQKQVDAIVENLHSEAEHRRAQLELQGKEHLLQVERAHNESIKNVADYIRQGGNPTAYQQPAQNIPSTPLTPSTIVPGTQPDMVDVPGVGPRPISAFQTQGQHENAIAEAAGLKAKAEAGAQQPFRLEQLQTEGGIRAKLQKDENDFKKESQIAENAWKTNESKLDRQNRLTVEGMANATSLGVAHIAHDITPDQFRAGVFDAATGQSAKAYTGDNVFDRAVQTGVQANGMRLFPIKDREAAQQMTRLLPVFSRLEDWADKYLPHESQYGGPGASALSMVERPIQQALPTDAKKDLQTIQGQALVLGKGLEGMTGGRFNNKQLELDLNSIGNLGQTSEQAKRGIAALKDTYLTQQQNSLMGGMPEEQKRLNYKTWGIAPPELVNAPRFHPTLKRKDGTPAQIDYDTSIDQGQPIYK